MNQVLYYIWQKGKVIKLHDFFSKQHCSFLLLPGSLCCTGSSRGRVWQPWAARGAPCSRLSWMRRRHLGSGCLQTGKATGWSSVDDRPLGSIIWCSNPVQLRTEQAVFTNPSWNTCWVNTEHVFLSNLPPEGPQVRRHGWEDKRVRCSDLCTPAQALSLEHPKV